MGRTFLDTAYSVKGCLHLVHLLNSETGYHVVISEIVFMINNRGIRSSRKQKEVQIREGVSSNAREQQGLYLPPGRAKISEKEPGRAEWWPLSDYEKMRDG